MFGALLSSILPTTSKAQNFFWNSSKAVFNEGFHFVSVAQALFVIDNRDRSFADLYYLFES